MKPAENNLFFSLQKQLALCLLPNFGYKRIRSILAHLDHLDEFFSVKKAALKKIPGLGEGLIRNLKRDEALKQAEQYLNYLEKNKDIQVHFYLDESFPKKLNECDDTPILLFSIGNMNLNPKEYSYCRY